MMLLYSFIFCLSGSCVFSFLNVVVYRLPRGISFVKGRSFCPSCKKQLKGYDMIPVLSWFILGGRCRNCKCRISPRYPAVEALGAVCAALCLVYFGSWNGYWYAVTLQAVWIFAVLSLLTVVALIDYDTMEIPNSLVTVGALLALAAVWLFPGEGLLSRTIGFFSVSLPLFLLTLAVPGAFGGGDIKLMAVMGFFLGWRMCLAAFFIAILLGGIYGIYLLAAGKKTRKDHFAFGPFLCVGIAAAIFVGQPLLSWYLQLVL